MRRALLLALALFACPLVANADDAKDEALSHWNHGLELYNEQDFPNALIEFRKAYEIAPTYKVLYNIGQVCFQLTDYACALNSFEQYLRDGAANIAGDRRKEVDEYIVKLRTRVGALEIVSNIAGAEVFIDDAAVGTTPLAKSITVSAGRRKITVSKDGYGKETRIIDIAGTDSLRVEIKLPDPTARPRPPEPPTIVPSRWTTWSYVGLGTASALAVAGGVTGILALRAERDLEERRFVGNEPSAAFDASSRRISNLALATDLLLGGAVVTLATTVTLTLIRTPKKEHAATTVSFGVAPTGCFLQGSF